MTTPRVRATRSRRGGVGPRTSGRIQRATRQSQSYVLPVRRRVAAKAFGAGEALRASVSLPPLNGDEIRSLFSLAGREVTATRLGLPADADLELLFSDPSLLSSMNPDAPDRARQLYDELRANISQFGPSAGRIHTESTRISEQLQKPIEPDEALDEQSFFERNFPLTRKALGVGLTSLRGIVSGLDISAPTRGGSARISLLEAATAPLDIISETSAEALAQLPKLLKSDFGELEAPTLFTEGPEESLRQFRERPFKEQLALGLLDPFLFAGISKTGLRVATGSVGRIAAKDVAAETARVAARKELQEEFKRAGAPLGTIPEPSRLDAMVKPRKIKFFGKEAPSFIRRRIDASGELHRMPLDSPERLIGEASLRHARGEVIANGLVETTMAWMRSRAKDVDDLWGLPTRKSDFPEPRTTKVTRDAKGRLLREAPLHGNVIERPHLFQLTDAQLAWIDDIKTLFPKTLKYMQSEGLDVAEFGKWEEMFNFFPRKVIDTTTRKSNIRIDRGSNIGKHRVFDQMDTAVLGKSSSYAPWEEATAAHLKGVYKAVLDKRLADELEPLARSQAVNKRILQAQADAKALVVRQTESIRDVKSAIRGFVPGAQTIKGMQRRFPDLADRIGVVMKLRPTEVNEIIRAAFPDPADASLAERFKEEMLRLIEDRAVGGPTPKGRLPRDLKRPDVLGVIKKLGLEKAVEARVRRATLRQTEKLFKGARKAELDALLDRMEVLASRAKTESVERTRIATLAKERATTTRSGELRGPAGTPLQDKIFDSATALDLEKALVDNGSKLWQPISRGVGVLRQMRTIFDFGAPFIQGLPVLFRDPQLWGEATQAHYLAFLKPEVRGRYVAANALDITEMVEHGGLLGSSEFTEAMADGGWFARLPTQITNSGFVPEPIKPVLSGAPRIVSLTAQRFGNSFETFLDLSRVEMWKALRPLAKNADDLDDVASFVNHLTGVMSPKALGIPLSQQEFEAAVPFFAPRYARAIASLYNDAFRGGIRGDQARRSLAGVLFGAGAMHVAMATALGQTPNLDPTNAGKFLRTQMEGQMVGFVPKPLTYFKNLSKITKTSVTEPDKFLSLNIFNSEDVAENPLLQAIQNQSSILASTGISILRGSDPIGRIVPGFSEPVEALKFWGQEQFPFWVDAGLEAEGAGGIGVASGFEFIGGSTFPVPPWQRVNELLDKYAQEDYGVSWDELKERSFGGQTEKRAMMLAHDDLRATQDTADAEQLGKANSRKKRLVLDELSAIRSDWLDATSKAGDNFLRLLDGSNSPTKFRQEVGAAGDKAKGGRTTLERQNPDVYADFNDVYDDIAEDDPAQAARQEFFDKLASAVNKTTGRTDYAIVDRIRAEIDQVYGEGMMASIDEQQRAHQSQLLEGEIHPIVQEYFTSFETLRPYWQAFQVALPEEQWEAWQVFAAADDFRKEEFRRSREVPYLAMEKRVKATQDQLQAASPVIDLALLRFYGRTPRNRENILNLQNTYRKRLTSRQ